MLTNDGIVEILKNMDITCPVPDPSEIGVQAARWVADPQSLLVHLTELLNRILDRCEPIPGGDFGVEYRLRPEYLESMNPWLIVLETYVDADVYAVDFVNRFGNIPFGRKAVHDVYDACKSGHQTGDWREFTVSVLAYKRNLQELADWIQFRRETKSPSPPGAEIGKIESATPDDTVAFLKSLKLVLCATDRTVHRDGAQYTHLEPVQLSPSLWDMLLQLLKATQYGVTRRRLADILRTTEGAVSTRKTALKDKLHALNITIPGDEFRIESLC